MWAFVTLAVLLVSRCTLAIEVGGYDLCIGPYALCAGSPCTATNSTHAACTCRGPFNGLNLGNSTCLARANSLISTFSVEGDFITSIQPKEYNFLCTGENGGPFAVCLDAACSTESGAVVCTCRMASGDHNYRSEICPTTAAETQALCKQLKSTSAATKTNSSASSNGTMGSGAAGAEGIDSVVGLLGAFYAYPPELYECDAPGA